MASFSLLSPPANLITSLNFNSLDNLYVTTFKGDIKSYREVSESCKPTSVIENFPDSILDSCIRSGNDSLYLAGLTGGIYTIERGQSSFKRCQFEHESGVQCIVNNSSHQMVLTGSWDRSGWVIPYDSDKDAHKLQLKGKVQTMDSTGNFIVYGISTGENVIYDLRNLDHPVDTREAGFNYPLSTSLRMIPGGKGFVQGSMEGKVSVEVFGKQQEQADKYTFKCHRTVLTDDVEFVGPVNDISFLDQTRFFTAGSNVDRRVCLWDYTTKKRVKQYRNLPMGITKLQYNHKLGLLAIAMSDDSFKNSVSIEEGVVGEKGSVIMVINH